VAVEITVILDGSAGGMARVVAALKRFGLAFSGHHIEPAGNDRSRLVVSAEGHAVTGELRDRLSQVKGVLEVVQIGAGDGAAAPAGRRAARPGEAAASLEALADRIVNDYPKILRHVDAFEASVPANQLSQQLRLLGRRVGGKLGQQDAILQEAQTLHEALESSVVQILDGISEPEVVGSDIRVRLSVFTRRQVNTMDLVFGGEASRCDFLSGMIEGMIEGVSGLPNVHVEETSCRTNGDEYCRFHVSS
jgi:predicted hydrocarbon binding protein